MSDVLASLEHKVAYTIKSRCRGNDDYSVSVVYCFALPSILSFLSCILRGGLSFFFSFVLFFTDSGLSSPLSEAAFDYES